MPSGASTRGPGGTRAPAVDAPGGIKDTYTYVAAYREAQIDRIDKKKFLGDHGAANTSSGLPLKYQIQVLPNM